MERLINTYRKMPSPTNRRKLASYIDKHMMAVCMCSKEQTQFLILNGFI